MRRKSVERIGAENGSIQRIILTDETHSGKTLWDLLGLAGTLAVPFLLLYIGSQIQKKDREIAEINLREEALQSYLDRVSEVLIENKVRSLDPHDPPLELVKDVLRVKTLSILRSLDGDGERKGSVIKFLVDANLMGGGYIVLNLSSASLKGVKLSGTSLSRACLSNADLRNADLSSADLSNADLRDADLRDADLSSAELYGADLSNANLRSSELTNAKLHDVDLRDADLSSAELYGADLSNANLRSSKLVNTKLHDAELTGADFKNACLENVAGLKPDQARVALNL